MHFTKANDAWIAKVETVLAVKTTLVVLEYLWQP